MQKLVSVHVLSGAPSGPLDFIRELSDSDIERQPYATIVRGIEDVASELECLQEILSDQDILLEDNSIHLRSKLHEIRLALVLLCKRSIPGAERAIVALDGYASMFAPDNAKRLHDDFSAIDPLEYLDTNVAMLLKGCRRLLNARRNADINADIDRFFDAVNARL